MLWLLACESVDDHNSDVIFMHCSFFALRSVEDRHYDILLKTSDRAYVDVARVLTAAKNYVNMTGYWWGRYITPFKGLVGLVMPPMCSRAAL